MLRSFFYALQPKLDIKCIELHVPRKMTEQKIRHFHFGEEFSVSVLFSKHYFAL